MATMCPRITNGTKASDALHHLSAEEISKAGNYHFLKDAKLSVASSLLKRLFVVTTTNIPWSQVQFTRQSDPKHGKPCHLPPDGSAATTDFNVSHQAGLVALAGCRLAEAQLGDDVVCVSERNERQTVQRERVDYWVDMHAEVFSAGDLQGIKETSEVDTIDLRLRKFYAYWCLKEAYVKLVGEGLLAKWMKDVEFRGVRIPRPATATWSKAAKGEPWGERVTGIEVWVGGRLVEDVEMVLQAFEETYMIGTAIKRTTESAAAIVPTFRILDLEKDVYPLAA